MGKKFVPSQEDMVRLASEMNLIKDQMEDLILQSKDKDGDEWNIARIEWRERAEWAGKMEEWARDNSHF